MRFKRVELSPANKRQYLIALGVRDIELLLGEAINAANHTPLTKDNKYDKRRLGAIVKGLKDALAVAQKDGDKGTRVPVSERDEYSNEDTGNPLEDITRLEIIDHRPCVDCNGEGIIRNEHAPTRGLICGTCHGMQSKGRQVIFWDKNTRVESSVQDDGRTLKLFIDKVKEKEDFPQKIENHIKSISLNPEAVEKFMQLLDEIGYPRDSK